jgi:hypothetical protein
VDSQRDQSGSSALGSRCVERRSSLAFSLLGRLTAQLTRQAPRPTRKRHAGEVLGASKIRRRPPFPLREVRVWRPGPRAYPYLLLLMVINGFVKTYSPAGLKALREGGRRGGLKGGPARNRNLSPARKSEIGALGWKAMIASAVAGASIPSTGVEPSTPPKNRASTSGPKGAHDRRRP